MKVLVLAVVVALMGAAAARADQIPAGFVANASLSAPASFVAGKPVTVYCAPTQAALSAVAAGYDAQAVGVTPVVGGSVYYLAPKACSFIAQWQAGKTPKNLYGLAVSIETVAHEAEHAKGVRDETDADCAALRVMPAMVLKYFPTRGRETLHRMMAAAWTSHNTAPRAYRTHPC